MDELIDMVEQWCKERGYKYTRHNSEWEPSTLTILQKNGLLITMRGETIAINDHLGWACNKNLMSRQEHMRAIEYLCQEDPSLFDRLQVLIEGDKR